MSEELKEYITEAMKAREEFEASFAEWLDINSDAENIWEVDKPRRNSAKKLPNICCGLGLDREERRVLK